MELAREREKEDDIVDEDDFTGYIPDECFLDDYNEQMLVDVMNEQDKLIKWLKAHGGHKTVANRLLLIFDDMVGSSLFSNARNNAFKRLNSNLRHYSASAIIVSQSYKELPRICRVNASGVILFETPNEKELEVLYEENPCSLKKNDWLSCYYECTADPFSFMMINYKRPKQLRISKRFDEFLLCDTMKGIPDRRPPMRSAADDHPPTI
ncbi:uncharacterized protein SPPG_00930 [Spizellomyces punctatus DAOM BR117]|uniref:Uncharacterized protein n=1 Tax=Spizellomyces punctatus (strain DAOM BR117) TaxID=645134 RepID=A0A0L0HQS4_SPIPD|nr:uncharacterized protein SPPG_00930 [Spizellomyces punctatus DAOM BR117]KND03447.1 hypothetical protein SPPG_00930 [Spizellomyces punctatus DAOM BR117]|eukprot:XP_016611486.1 hypothetical protein SPPG_00930 [Spizellomyces punctatus DAOM BR117]